MVVVVVVEVVVVVVLRGGPRARPRYPGVEDLIRRATFLRETHPWRRRRRRRRRRKDYLMLTQ